MIVRAEKFARPSHCRTLVCTSGYFSPIHRGHLKLIEESKKLGDCLVVIVNSDRQSYLKKGYSPIDEITRLSIIDSLKWVDYSILCIDEDSSVCQTLQLIRPDIFTKGGSDRLKLPDLNENELRICEQIECRIITGVGGTDKLDSSSRLLEQIKQHDEV